MSTTLRRVPLTPRTILIPNIWSFETPTAQEVMAHLCIPNTTGVAVWTGNHFEVSHLKNVLIGGLRNNYQDRSFTLQWQDDAVLETLSIMHYPIDERIIESDVAGATLALGNDDGDGWLFQHVDEDWHRDHELQIRSSIVAAFERGVDGLMRDAMAAIGSSNAVQTRGKWASLIFVRDAAIEGALAAARKRHISWYQQHPNRHEGSLHILVDRGIDDAVKALKVANPSLLASVQTEVDRAKRDIQPHRYETRWDQAARIAAEEQAKQDQDEGNEQTAPS